MNIFIETLNQWGENVTGLVRPMLWQSSLLIVILLALDYLCQRHLRAAVRHALWLVVLVKLCLPPGLALPTSPVWWLHKTPPPVVQTGMLPYTVNHDQGPSPVRSPNLSPELVPPGPGLTWTAWLLVVSAGVSGALLCWLLVRWGQVNRRVRSAATCERLTAIASEAQASAGIKFNVPVKVTANSMSPAVCGLFRPVILMPQSLADHFSDEQLRAVLLHELIHVCRRDVWLNFWQALLQIVYWWHPLVWVANARIRQVREEAVDDAVVLALRDEAEGYAPTLLAVAKLALSRPLASLGLVGIMESRHALRQRIERLVDGRTPRRAGLTLVSSLGLLAFSAVAVPMGDAPPEPDTGGGHRPAVLITAEFYAVPNVYGSKTVMPLDGPDADEWMDQWKMVGSITAAQFAKVREKFNTLGVTPFARPQIKTYHGMEASFSVGDKSSGQTNGMQFTCRPLVVDGGIKLEFRAEIMGTAAGNDRALAGTVVNGDNLIKDRTDIIVLPVNPVSSDKKHLVLIIGAELVTNDLPARPDARATPVRQLHIKARFLEAPKGTLAMALAALTKFHSLTNGDQKVAGILTSQQQRILWQSLKARSGVEILGEPEGIILSGRQMQLWTTETYTRVKKPAGEAGSSAEAPQTVEVETGPVFDATAKILADGYTIDLKASAQLMELFKAGVPHPGRLPGPPAGASIKLWDDQTVFMGMGKHIYDGGKEVDAEPADLVKFTRTGREVDEEKKERLVLVTVTEVDAAGNRVHGAEEMSFAQNAVPPQ